MVEKVLVPLAVVMMAAAAIYAFSAHPSAGITGAAVAGGEYDCVDSDNNDPFTAGIIVSDIYPEGFAKDTCVGNDLLEYYCSGSDPAVRAVSCPRGCIADACVINLNKI